MLIMNAMKICCGNNCKAWWIVALVGILMMVCGIAYWFWPLAGYSVASMLFGWMLVATGVVQLVVSSGINRPRNWGWWLVGGVLDIFIGFMLVRNVVLSESLFPYFLAAVFVYWGVTSLIAAVLNRGYRFWWLRLINGLLMLFIGFFFLEAGFLQDILMASTLVSLAFIYWGITMVVTSLDMKPGEDEDD